MSKNPGVLPNFLIIGAQKSGTTSLTHYLHTHPSVFIPVKEVHYFDQNYSKGLSWYKAQFAGVTGEQKIGETTPAYMYHKEAADLMAKTLPEAKLVAILRNPVDRAYSHYWHNRTRGQEPLEFIDALIAEPQRLATENIRARARYSYLDRGRYLSQLQRICQNYSYEGLQVILFEEMRDSPIETFRSLCQFLEINDSLSLPGIGKRKNRFMTFRSMKLRKPIRLLPTPLRRIATRLNMRYSTYPPMDPSVRAELLKRFEDDNAALEVRLGRNLSIWKQ